MTCKRETLKCPWWSWIWTRAGLFNTVQWICSWSSCHANWLPFRLVTDKVTSPFGCVLLCFKDCSLTLRTPSRMHGKGDRPACLSKKESWCLPITVRFFHSFQVLCGLCGGVVLCLSLFKFAITRKWFTVGLECHLTEILFLLVSLRHSF